jgi:hypothetical protein
MHPALPALPRTSARAKFRRNCLPGPLAVPRDKDVKLSIFFKTKGLPGFLESRDVLSHLWDLNTEMKRERRSWISERPSFIQI